MGFNFVASGLFAIWILFYTIACLFQLFWMLPGRTVWPELLLYLADLPSVSQRLLCLALARSVKVASDLKPALIRVGESKERSDNLWELEKVFTGCINATKFFFMTRSDVASLCRSTGHFSHVFYCLMRQMAHGGDRGKVEQEGRERGKRRKGGREGGSISLSSHARW